MSALDDDAAAVTASATATAAGSLSFLAGSFEVALAAAAFFFLPPAVVVAAIGSGTAAVVSPFAFFLGDDFSAAGLSSVARAPSTPARASADSSIDDLDGASDLRVRFETMVGLSLPSFNENRWGDRW